MSDDSAREVRRRFSPWAVGGAAALLVGAIVLAVSLGWDLASEAALGLDREDRVLVQSGLLELGYPTGEIDGRLGTGTRAALRAWQSSRGEEPTGYLTAASADLLRAVGDRAVIDLGGDLHDAAEDGNTEEMKALLAAGADPNARTKFDHGHKWVWDELDWESGLGGDLHDATEDGNTEEMKALLAAGADPNARTKFDHGHKWVWDELDWESGSTPLHYAVVDGHLESVKLLLAAGADPNVQTDLTGATPLLKAVGKVEIMKALIAAGADPNIQSIYSLTQMFFSLSQAMGIDPDTSGSGEAPLHRAVFLHDLESMKVLIDAGADVTARGSMLNRTPLRLGALIGDAASVELLIVAGADVNEAGCGTPLHDAAFAGDLEIVELLIAAGVDAMARDKCGETPLDYADEALLWFGEEYVGREYDAVRRILGAANPSARNE